MRHFALDFGFKQSMHGGHGRLSLTGSLLSTYQLGNFREMAAFVDFAKGFNCDFAIFERLQNLGAFTWEEFRERAVHLSDHPLHEEFLTIISNSKFGQQVVWHDFEWEGAAKMSEEDARARLSDWKRTVDDPSDALNF